MHGCLIMHLQSKNYPPNFNLLKYVKWICLSILTINNLRLQVSIATAGFTWRTIWLKVSTASCDHVSSTRALLTVILTNMNHRYMTGTNVMTIQKLRVQEATVQLPPDSVIPCHLASMKTYSMIVILVKKAATFHVFYTSRRPLNIFRIKLLHFLLLCYSNLAQHR